MAQRGQNNQQAPAALARPVIVPKPFAARIGDDWNDWLSSFESACVVNGYADGDRIRFMGALVEGTAGQIFRTTQAANQNATYPQLCGLLANHFEPPQQSQLHETQLRARVKLPNETQAAYASSLRSLASRAFPAGGQIVNRIVLQQFIDGQPTPELRLQLSTNRPATLDDAVQRAITITTAYQVEALRNGTTRVQETVAAATNNAPQTEQAQLIAVLQRLEQKLDTLTMGQQPPLRRSYRDTDRRCYVCNEPGHFARNCPNRRQGN